MSSLNTYPYVSRSKNDDSVDDALEILSNYYPTLAKDFLSHHPMRSHRIFFLLIRSDRFLIDHSQPSYTLHHTQNISYKPQKVMLRYEPKYKIMYMRYYGDYRSKDYLHYSH